MGVSGKVVASGEKGGWTCSMSVSLHLKTKHGAPKKPCDRRTKFEALADVIDINLRLLFFHIVQHSPLVVQP
jgi:hypothetical protein